MRWMLFLIASGVLALQIDACEHTRELKLMRERAIAQNDHISEMLDKLEIEVQTLQREVDAVRDEIKGVSR